MLVRADAAGGTHEFLDWLAGQRLSYSVGFTLPDDIADVLAKIPEPGWTPAYDADGQARDGRLGRRLTGLLDLSGWPAGMRVIVRKERPHPGAQLRLTDVDGHRLTAFATNTRPGGPGRQLADLELRHRRRARAEDRIRVAKDTGLRNLPLHDFAQNQIWCAIVALACELTAWMQLLALHRHPRPAVGTQTAAAAAASPSPAGSPAPAGAPCCTCPTTHPGPGSCRQAITTLRALPAPG